MAEVVKRFEIPRTYLHDFADGLAADQKVQRYATWNALRRHCELVGGSVARMVACVLGVTHSDGAMFAGKIGVATRLVQILRNFGRDPLRGDNLYFPLEELVRYKCLGAMESPSVGRLDHGVVSEEAHRFADFSRFQVERAREFLREGSEGLCWLAGDGSRMAAAMFVTRQMGKLDALEECEMNPTRAKKRDRWPSRRLRHLSNAWRLARRTPDEPLPRVG
jgi:phytoene/squalene synthetase